MKLKINNMKSQKCYLIGLHSACFRFGEISEIIGVAMVTPDSKKTDRLAYKIVFFDGVEDYVPISEVGVNYQIITVRQVITLFAFKIP